MLCRTSGPSGYCPEGRLSRRSGTGIEPVTQTIQFSKWRGRDSIPAQPAPQAITDGSVSSVARARCGSPRGLSTNGVLLTLPPQKCFASKLCHRGYDVSDLLPGRTPTKYPDSPGSREAEFSNPSALTGRLRTSGHRAEYLLTPSARAGSWETAGPRL